MLSHLGSNTLRPRAAAACLVLATALLWGPAPAAARSAPSPAFRKARDHSLVCHQQKVLHLLKRHCLDPNTRDKFGTSLLHDLSLSKFGWSQPGNAPKCLALMDRLYRAGAVIDARNHRGETPLMYAALAGLRRAALFLLARGADVNAQAFKHKGTALMQAAFVGHVDMVRLLIQHGADPALRNSKGETALDLARRKHRTQVVAYLRGLKQSAPRRAGRLQRQHHRRTIEPLCTPEERRLARARPLGGAVAARRQASPKVSRRPRTKAAPRRRHSRHRRRPDPTRRPAAAPAEDPQRAIDATPCRHIEVGKVQWKIQPGASKLWPYRLWTRIKNPSNKRVYLNLDWSVKEPGSYSTARGRERVTLEPRSRKTVLLRRGYTKTGAPPAMDLDVWGCTAAR